MDIATKSELYTIGKNMIEEYSENDYIKCLKFFDKNVMDNNELIKLCSTYIYKIKNKIVFNIIYTIDWSETMQYILLCALINNNIIVKDTNDYDLFITIKIKGLQPQDISDYILEIFRIIVRKSNDLLDYVDEDDRTILWYACMLNETTLIKHLLKYGIMNMFKKEKKGTYPFWFLCKHNNMEIIDSVVDKIYYCSYRNNAIDLLFDFKFNKQIKKIIELSDIMIQKHINKHQLNLMESDNIFIKSIADNYDELYEQNLKYSRENKKFEKINNELNNEKNYLIIKNNDLTQQINKLGIRNYELADQNIKSNYFVQELENNARNNLKKYNDLNSKYCELKEEYCDFTKFNDHKDEEYTSENFLECVKEGLNSFVNSYLLKRRIFDIDKVFDEKTGDTPLIIACREKHTNIALILLDNVKDCRIANKKGETPYTWAYYHNIVPVMIKILNITKFLNGSYGSYRFATPEYIVIEDRKSESDKVIELEKKLKIEIEKNTQYDELKKQNNEMQKTNKESAKQLLEFENLKKEMEKEESVYEKSFVIAVANGKLLHKTPKTQNTVNEALYEAVRNDHYDITIELLKKGADAKHGDLLDEACKNNNINMVKLLLEYGSKLSSSSLFYACNKNNDVSYELVKYLLENGCQISNDILPMVARKQSYNTIQSLITNGAKELDDALKECCLNKSLSQDIDIKMIQLLLDNGANYKVIKDAGITLEDKNKTQKIENKSKNSNNNKVIQNEAEEKRFKDPEFIRKLQEEYFGIPEVEYDTEEKTKNKIKDKSKDKKYDKSTEINTESDNMAFIISASRGKIIDMKYKIDQKILDEALHKAVKNNHTEIVEELLKMGANTELEFPHCINMASENNNLVIIKQLVKCGANMNDYTLFKACNKYNDESFELVKFLLENNCSIRNDILELVARKESYNTMELLLKYTKGNINKALKEVISVKEDKYHKIDNKMVKILLENGADVNIIKKAGIELSINVNG